MQPTSGSEARWNKRAHRLSTIPRRGVGGGARLDSVRVRDRQAPFGLAILQKKAADQA